MRVKTEAKRNEILKAAVAEFSQRGFHETTLADVAKRMGSSKATIYNYYQTKAELFGAVLVAVATPVATKLMETFDRPAPFSEQLRAFARAYVKMQAGEAAVKVHRLLISETELARETIRRFQDDPDVRAWRRLGDIIAGEQHRGTLGEGDPNEMASQLRALLHGGLPLRMLFGERAAFSEEEMEASADAAVRFFLRAYAA